MDSGRNGGPARVFGAFSDPTRLRLLALLRRGELCVCDLVSILRIPQGTASRHMSRLKAAGLVRSRNQGYWTYYSLSPARKPLHRSLLRCLDACVRDDATLRADARRRGTRCC